MTSIYFVVYDMQDNIIVYCDNYTELADFLKCTERQAQYTYSRHKRGLQKTVIVDKKHYYIKGYREHLDNL